MEKYCRAGQATDDNIMRRMRMARWITKATNTHTEYVILPPFPQQQWLHGRASMLRNTYSAPLVVSYFLIRPVHTLDLSTYALERRRFLHA